MAFCGLIAFLLADLHIVVFFLSFSFLLNSSLSPCFYDHSFLFPFSFLLLLHFDLLLSSRIVFVIVYQLHFKGHMTPRLP